MFELACIILIVNQSLNGENMITFHFLRAETRKSQLVGACSYSYLSVPFPLPPKPNPTQKRVGNNSSIADKYVIKCGNRWHVLPYALFPAENGDVIIFLINRSSSNVYYVECVCLRVFRLNKGQHDDLLCVFVLDIISVIHIHVISSEFHSFFFSSCP